MIKVFIFGNKSIHCNYFNLFANNGYDVKISFNAENSSSYDVLVLTGGNDVNPSLYGENIPFVPDFKQRDEKELKLIDTFVRSKKPIIGICRGLQIVNVFFGGTLSNVKYVQKHYADTGDAYHKVVCRKRSIFYYVYGDKFTVNSKHKQQINVLGEGLTVDAFSSDGLIEGVTHKNLPILLSQFHLERKLSEYGTDGIKLVNKFLTENL